MFLGKSSIACWFLGILISWATIILITNASIIHFINSPTTGWSFKQIMSRIAEFFHANPFEKPWDFLILCTNVKSKQIWLAHQRYFTMYIYINVKILMFRKDSHLSNISKKFNPWAFGKDLVSASFTVLSPTFRIKSYIPTSSTVEKPSRWRVAVLNVYHVFSSHL